MANWRKKTILWFWILKNVSLHKYYLENIEIIDVKKIYKNAEISFISKKEIKIVENVVNK